jgi:biopolymer transport protein ExbD
MKHRIVFAALALAAFMTSCKRGPEPSPPGAAAPTVAPASGSAQIKVWISKAGVIDLDGRIVELPELTAALDELAKHKGTVVFGQDVPDQAPHPNVIKALALIAERDVTFRSALNRGFTELSPDHHYDKSFLGRD